MFDRVLTTPDSKRAVGQRNRGRRPKQTGVDDERDKTEKKVRA